MLSKIIFTICEIPHCVRNDSVYMKWRYRREGASRYAGRTFPPPDTTYVIVIPNSVRNLKYIINA